MSVYSLVHGGQHGAWCFAPLAAELRRRGHQAIAADLPIGDPTAGAAEYARVVTDSLDGIGPEVIVVGHSMGGLVIPLVAALRPVARLVFLCGAFPEPGRSHFQVKEEKAAESVGDEARQVWLQPGDRHLATREAAREMFYNDCPKPLQDWALDRLQPQCRKPLTEVTPLNAWPSVPVSIINAADDRCIPPAAATATSLRLFGVAPTFVPGGHLPFLSRPELVAELLVGVGESTAQTQTESAAS